MRALAIATAATIALAGCASESEGTDYTPLPPPPGARTDVTLAPATPEPAGPKVVAIGEPISIPCSPVDRSVCMTVTFTDVRPGAACEMYGQELENDQAIALDVRAEMPTTVDPTFTSPFRSFPWSTFSSDNRFTKAMNKGCGGDYSSNDLMNEFPGGYAEATVYLDTLADVRAVVFEPNNGDTYLIEIAP